MKPKPHDLMLAWRKGWIAGSSGRNDVNPFDESKTEMLVAWGTGFEWGEQAYIKHCALAARTFDYDSTKAILR